MVLPPLGVQSPPPPSTAALWRGALCPSPRPSVRPAGRPSRLSHVPRPVTEGGQQL